MKQYVLGQVLLLVMPLMIRRRARSALLSLLADTGDDDVIVGASRASR